MKLRIKDLREGANLSQYEMAEKMKLTQSAYARFEMGKSKIDLCRVEVFARVLGMSVIDVITYPEKYVNVKERHDPQELTLRVEVTNDTDFIRKMIQDDSIRLLSYTIEEKH